LEQKSSIEKIESLQIQVQESNHITVTQQTVQQNTDLMAQLANRDQDIDKLKDENFNFNRVNIELTKENKTLVIRIEKLNALVQSLRNRITRLEQTNAELEAGNQESFKLLHNQNVSLQATIRANKTAYRELEQSMETLMNEHNDQQSKDQAKIYELQSEMNTMKTEFKHVDRLKVIETKYLSEIRDNNQRDTQWRRRMTNMESENASLKEETIKLRMQIKELDGTIVIHELEIRQQKVDIDELEDTIRGLRMRILKGTNFEQWDSEMIVLWMITLEMGRFAEYEENLRELLSQHHVTGSTLKVPAEWRASLPDFMDVADRTALMTHIRDRPVLRHDETANLKETIDDLERRVEELKKEVADLQRENRRLIVKQRQTLSNYRSVSIENTRLQTTINSFHATTMTGTSALEQAVSELTQKRKTLKKTIAELELRNDIRHIDEKEQEQHVENFSVRLEDAGAAKSETKGSLSISLMWDNSDATKNDLDLWVQCPGCTDWIGYEHQTCKCGGHLDVDRRSNVKKPVENIVWKEDAPDGDYKVQVHNFSWEKQNERVPFQVGIKKGVEPMQVIPMWMPVPAPNNGGSTASAPKEHVKVTTFSLN